MRGDCYAVNEKNRCSGFNKNRLKGSFLGFALRHNLLLQHQQALMEKSYENPAMKWVLDGCRRLTLSDTGVVDKIAHNKSVGDVLHRTAKKGDGSLRCASIAL